MAYDKIITIARGWMIACVMFRTARKPRSPVRWTTLKIPTKLRWMMK